MRERDPIMMMILIATDILAALRTSAPSPPRAPTSRASSRGCLSTSTSCSIKLISASPSKLSSTQAPRATPANPTKTSTPMGPFQRLNQSSSPPPRTHQIVLPTPLILSCTIPAKANPIAGSASSLQLPPLAPRDDAELTPKRCKTVSASRKPPTGGSVEETLPSRSAEIASERGRCCSVPCEARIKASP